MERAYGQVAQMSISQEKVLDQWHCIVEYAAGRGQWVMDSTAEFIKEANMPGVTCMEAALSSGVFNREKRPFLVVQHRQLQDYRFFIGARDFGAHLDASWYFTAEPKLGISKQIGVKRSRKIRIYSVINQNAIFIPPNFPRV